MDQQNPQTHATGVLIPQHISAPVHRVHIPLANAMDAIAGHVGSSPWYMPWGDEPEVAAYVGERSRFDSSINKRATALLTGTGRLEEGEWIAGNYLVVGWGTTSENGHAIKSLSPDLLAQLAPVRLSVEIHIGSGPETETVYHAAQLLKDIAQKMLDQGPIPGRAHIDDVTLATWEFS